MPTPVHTPYDGSARPFTIGLKKLDPREWIEIDAPPEDYLARKDALIRDWPDRVFRAEADTGAAQREVLAMLVPHLVERFPETYRRESNNSVAVGGAGRRVDLDAREPPLQIAARLVPDDLVVMRRGDTGWRLVAASLCFPSSWSLADKFARPLNDIHKPVPAFGPGTRNAVLIERIFDSMKIDQPVERHNWSLQADAELHKPGSKAERDRRVERSGEPLLGDDPAAGTFIRVERQTLRKLPVSGDILFTIRIHLDPLAALRRHEDRGMLAAGLAGQLAALDADQLAYKGVLAERDRLLEQLREIAGA